MTSFCRLRQLTRAGHDHSWPLMQEICWGNGLVRAHATPSGPRRAYSAAHSSTVDLVVAAHEVGGTGLG